MATLKDIAKEAGVSIMTVSNVINGKHHKVSATTIARVNEIIEKYHFIPNQTARNLVGKSSRIIGLIVPYLDHEDSLAQNPYNSEVIGAMEQLLRAQNYYLLLRSVKTLKEASMILRSWNVEGAIFLGSFNSELIESTHFNPIPLVFLDNYAKQEHVINVGLDDFGGEYTATNYLIEHGHRDIAFVSPIFDRTSENVFERRYSGYCKALADSGIPYEESYVFTCPVCYESGIDVVRQLRKQAPKVTAVCSSADIIAMGMIEGARKYSVRVPEELSIIGFDNLPATELVYPKLTSVTQDVYQKASIATQLLLKQIESKKVEPANVILDVQLSIKNSVCRHTPS